MNESIDEFTDKILKFIRYSNDRKEIIGLLKSEQHRVLSSNVRCPKTKQKLIQNWIQAWEDNL